MADPPRRRRLDDLVYGPPVKLPPDPPMVMPVLRVPSSPPRRGLPAGLKFALAIPLIVILGAVAWFVGFGLVAILGDLWETIR